MTEGFPDRLAQLRARWQADPSSRVFLQLAEEYRHQGRVKEALAVLDGGLKEHPGYLSALVAKGRCHLELGEAERARSVLERVVQQDPTQMVANKLLVRAYLETAEPTRARQRLELYTLLNDSDPEIEELDRRVAAMSRPPQALDGPRPEEPAERPRMDSSLPPQEGLHPAQPPSPPSTSATPQSSAPAADVFDLGPPPAAFPKSPASPASPTSPASLASRREEPVFALDFPPRAAESAAAAPGAAPVDSSTAPAAAAPTYGGGPDHGAGSGGATESASASLAVADQVAVAAAAAVSATGPEAPAVEAPAGPHPLAPLPPLPPLPPETEPFPDLSSHGRLARYLESLNAEGIFAFEGFPAAESVEPAASSPPGQPAETASVRPPATAAAEEGSGAIAGSETSEASAGADSAAATATLGFLYLRQGHLPEAERIFREVVRREPDNAAAGEALARIERRRQPLDAALLLDGFEAGTAHGVRAKKTFLLNSYLRRLKAGPRHVS